MTGIQEYIIMKAQFGYIAAPWTNSKVQVPHDFFIC